MLEATARRRIEGGQQVFEFEELAPESRPAAAGGAAPVTAGAYTVGSRPRLLWDVLNIVYDRIGFDQIDSAAFRQLVVARVIAPESKTATLETLRTLDVTQVVSERTMWRHLGRCVTKNWRDTACQAAYRFAAGDGVLAVVLYDVTTLYFETDEEDEHRKVGFSKERRVDPQILVGLLVDKHGFPLEIHSFTGNSAETNTIIPVLDAFKARHSVEDMLVVADAGMLSFANLQALEQAGYQYIVGSRNSKAPYDLAETFASRGNNFTDGEVFEATTSLKKNVASSQRRAVWQYRLAREHRDRRSHTKQVQRAEDIAAGRKPQRRARFVTGGGPKTVAVDYEAAQAAELYFGLKGYVTSASQQVMSAPEVISAYHSLFEVERSFRMSKTDLRARPIFSYTRDSIEAHLSVVFCALAISRHIQQATGQSIRRFLRTLQPLREAVIDINGQLITVPAALTPEARDILSNLNIDPTT